MAHRRKRDCGCGAGSRADKHAIIAAELQHLLIARLVRTAGGTRAAAVGGAMDLAIGAKQTFVIMDLFTK